MTSTPPPNIRLTISITPEVHATFQRMSEATSMSMSKAIGGWLTDTSEAAEYLTKKLVEARTAPKKVIAEMHAYALGVADETGKLMENLRERGRAERAAVRATPLPPPSNTGGKGTKAQAQSKGRGR